MDVKCNFADSVTEEKVSSDKCTTPKDRVIDLLDEVDRHVDILRRDLLLLDEKKDELLTTLDTIRHCDLVAQLSTDESSEIEEYADRLVRTCSAIDIKVTTHRDQQQEDALFQVNRLIDSLVLVLRSDPKSARARCLSYVSACSNRGTSCKAIEVDAEEEEEEEAASSSSQQQFIPDAVFEEVMFLCTPDDRKRVQRRLHGLLSYIEREMVPLLPTTL
ncbi:BAG family molecular chaperone regulator 2 [Hetaerina americana]|uniref:BAG family molecular chaperone regulator 2 n=1 Tax=Hetaerina americana TaxID=62018 RepID=UPI003A7F1560